MAAQWYDANVSIPGCDKNQFKKRVKCEDGERL
jgi:hypothetical protein